MARRRDILQNMAITALALTALFLFSQTHFFRLGASAGRTYLEGDNDAGAVSTTDTLSGSFSAPLRLVVTDDYSTGGSVMLTTADEDFLPLKNLLAEALGSARQSGSCSRAEFQSAVTQISVFCDFFRPLPISYLAALCGSSAELTLKARSVLVSAQEDGVFLYLWDGEQQYYRCSTALQSSSLSAVQAQPGGVAFAYAQDKTRFLFPFTVLPTEPLSLYTLAVSSPVNLNTLLTAFDFNPHTNSRYTEAGGTQVIIDGDRTLRLQTDGVFLYQGGAQTPLQIPSQTDTPTVSEAVAGVYALLNKLLSAGDARLYLESVEQRGSRLTLRFGCHLQGIPIFLSDGGCAAEATLSGNTVTALTCCLRQYTLTEDAPALLPLTQAAAVAAARGCATLSVGYADRGGESVCAVWLSD